MHNISPVPELVHVNVPEQHVSGEARRNTDASGTSSTATPTVDAVSSAVPERQSPVQNGICGVLQNQAVVAISGPQAKTLAATAKRS